MVTTLLICAAWILVGTVIWEVGTTLHQAVAAARRMHQIPCLNCQFLSDSHYLKCTLHPMDAMTEAAINCPDYGARPRIME